MDIAICLDRIETSLKVRAALDFAYRAQKENHKIIFLTLLEPNCHPRNVNILYTGGGKIIDFPIFHLSEFYDREAIFIALDVKSNEFTQKLPRRLWNAFYCWDLEWLNQKDFYYSEIYEKYGMANNLWCRSPDHKAVLENTCGAKVKKVISNFQYDLVMGEIEHATL